MNEAIVQCAHCKRSIGDQIVKHELSFPKDGPFRVTYKYRICDKCYELYNLAKQVIPAPQFPEFKSDFVGEYDNRAESEKLVYGLISNTFSYITPCVMVGPKKIEHVEGILDE